MSKKTIAIILAAAGITFHGVESADAKALARALQVSNKQAIQNFLRDFPESPYVADVVLSVLRERLEKKGEKIREIVQARLRPGYRG